TGTQNIQSNYDVALLDAQHAVETTSRGIPLWQRIPCRVITQHRHMTPCRCEIAYQKCDWARASTKRVAQRKLVSEGPSIVNIALDSTQGLIGKSLQPKNRGEGVMRNRPLIVSETDGMKSLS